MTSREVSELWTHRNVSTDDHHLAYPAAFIPETLDLNKELPPMPRPSMEQAEPVASLYGSDDRHSEDGLYVNTGGWLSTDIDNDSEPGDVGEYLFVNLASLRGSNEGNCWRCGMILFRHIKGNLPCFGITI